MAFGSSGKVQISTYVGSLSRQNPKILGCALFKCIIRHTPKNKHIESPKVRHSQTLVVILTHSLIRLSLVLRFHNLTLGLSPWRHLKSLYCSSYTRTSRRKVMWSLCGAGRVGGRSLVCSLSLHNTLLENLIDLV